MENNNRVLASTFTALLLLGSMIVISIASLRCRSKTIEQEKGFAVIELFTSEGCEYCPPAHEVLAKIQKDNPTRPIYTLAYHVDFWDREKWKDRFSNAEFSRRQVNYAKSLNVPLVYAPQVVVNGKREFVGTDESRIANFINELLIVRPKADLSIQATQDDNKLILNYQVKGVSENSYLQVAIVKRLAEGKVEEGKHIGHLFTHVQTVRAFHSKLLAKDGKGITTIKLPQAFNSKEWEIVAMIQDFDKKGELLAATRVDL